MKKLKEIFNGLEANQKRKVILIGLVVVMILLLMMGYRSRTSNKPQEVKQEPVKQKTIDLTAKDEDLALRLSFQNQIKEMQDNNSELVTKQAQELEELKRHLDDIRKNPYTVNSADGIPKYGDLDVKGIPESPYNTNDIPMYSPSAEPVTDKKPPIIITGGIGIVTVSAKSQSDNATKDLKSTGNQLVNYIPSGTVLKATLLNGMFAPTMSKGASKPYPALLRLWDMAFLPNGFRKDLSGCFIMGEAYGELSDSRVHIRLSRLSCISNNEKRVLEKDIKGFVNGDDGKVGVFGEIRANFGKIALAALLAEFLAAAGETVKTASQSVIQNPLGGITTTFPKTEDILASAAGSGFGEAAKMIAEFYLDIMKEMTPVIEISGRRDVEIIVDKGLELLLDDFKWEGVKEDESNNITDILSHK